MQPAVAIILVNWNGLEVTRNCIDSLQSLHYTNHSVIVVDNASTDGSADALEKAYPHITVISSSTNTGFAGGNNIGFRYAFQSGFDYLLMLNNDTIVEPDFLSHLVSYMEQHPDTGVIQPRIHFEHNKNVLWNSGSYYAKWWGFLYTRRVGQPPVADDLKIKQVDWVTGCAFLTRSSLLQQTGLLAENMFMYSEDVDLSFRIAKMGYKLVYHPDALIYHIAGMSNKTAAKGKEGYVHPLVHYYNQRNRIWILKKYTPAYAVITTVIANFFYISLIIGYFAIRGRFNKLKAVIRAVKDGLLGSIENQPL